VDAGNRAEQLLAALQQEIQVLQHQANRPDLDLQALLRAMPAEELAETVFRSLDPRQLERFLRFLENFRRQDQDWTAIESDVEKLVPLPMAIVRHFVLGLAGDRYPELRTVEELSRKLQDEFFVRLEFRSKVDWFRAWALLRYGLKAAQVLHNPPHSVHQFVEEAMHYGAKRSSRAHSNDSATRTPPSPGMTSPPSAETGSRAAATQTHTSQRSGGTKPEPAQSERHWQPPQGGTRYASSHNSSTTGQTGPTPNSYPHNSANRPHNSGGDRRTPPTSSVKSPPGKPPAAADVLGLTWPATIEEIKAAYRRLAKQNHPDLGGDLLQFQQIQDAYQQLMAVVGR
jgi:hypothetical protein